MSTDIGFDKTYVINLKSRQKRRDKMEKTLLISLFIIEIVAFGWLILEAKVSRRQRAQILTVEKQILRLEKTIISMERTIIKKVSKISDFTKRERLLLDNEKLIKNNDNKL